MAGAQSKLETYRAKRNFARTSEPPGETSRRTAAKPRFVVQRHRARRLHYDLRFEIDGVLVSFAVPRGPTLDPSAKRLAVRTEDHPIEYLDFEGVIPSGEYGGGDVIVWDRGVWELHGATDARQALTDGELHVDVFGDKLKGRLVLIQRGDERQWLLLHKRDAHAEQGWDAEDHPRSVLSGRTNDEVAAAPDAVWYSDRPAAEAEVRIGSLPQLDIHWIDDIAALGPHGELSIDGHTVRFTNLNKVLFPARDGVAPVTKGAMIGYYLAVAPVLLPRLRGRAVNLHRYPNGASAKGFWQREVPSSAPDWVTRWHYHDAGEDEAQYYFVVDSVSTLAWLANYAAIELHPWISLITDPQRPTGVVFDVDAGSRSSWDDIVTLARLHRTAFEHLGLAAFPKVSGGTGIQVVVPVTGDHSFEQTAQFAEQVSRSIGRVVPELVSWQWQVAQRRGRTRLDYTQNAITKTIVAPYSVRPAPGAPVSMPISWHELDDAALLSDRWTIRSALERIAEVGDLWADIDRVAQLVPPLSAE